VPAVRTTGSHWLAAAAFAAVAGCGSTERGDGAAAYASPLIYGADDRENWYQLDEPLLRALAADATVALVDSSLAAIDDRGVVSLPDDSYRELYDLCEGEAFADEPSIARCSGVLIADDLVLTAAHCLRALPCEALSLVFGFYYAAEDELNEIRDDDVFACEGVAAFRYERGAGGATVDYAVLRLDRPAQGRRPARVDRDAAHPRPGEHVAVIGNGAGLPTKIDRRARVTAAQDGASSFVIAADTFHGGSGSGVYDSAGTLHGVLVRGGEDYESGEDGCQRVRVADARAIGEQIGSVAPALVDLCTDGAALCEGERAANCSVRGAARMPAACWSWLAAAGALVLRAAARRQRR